ncbi:MAG: hypothetical protein EOO17_05000 [Chloroflexi bacterium]|nr:MAG: hypothetical protein EOO17_05000 [Chloroflexota bacterium]
MDSGSARQQIVDSIKNSTTILVTVSTNPSVDELSAALGLTVLLNNLEKRATSVVSGAIPPAITFLDPQKTFANTVDSLRDFIIALDKEKADHLRYKVEGDSVKIFITPYRTKLSDKDLEFSQGDYNVELVIALGVKDQDHLDKALMAHGRILHDATVATISAGADPSTLGSIDWRDATSSSLCEMLVSLTEALKTDAPLLDEQIATAFLTGIVSATDRFSNERTSSRVMTMAAQLMAAGANQQLIAAKLQEAHDIGPNKRDQPSDDAADNDDNSDDATLNLSDNKSRSNRDRKKKKKNDNGLQIDRNKQNNNKNDVAESAFAAAAAVSAASIDGSNGDQPDKEKDESPRVQTQDTLVQPAPINETDAIVQDAVAVAEDTAQTEKQLEDQLSQITDPAAPSLADIQSELAGGIPVVADQPLPVVEQSAQTLTTPTDTSMPGFEVTDVQPAISQSDKSPLIQSTHDNANYINDQQSSQDLDSIVSGAVDPTVTARAADINPFSVPLPELPTIPESSVIDQTAFAVPEPAPYISEVANVAADPVQQTVPQVSDLPSASVQAPAPVELPPLPQMPDFSSFPPPPPPPPAPTLDQLGGLPPQPNLPTEPTDIFGSNPSPAAPEPPSNTPPEPGQFRIPGQ